MKTFAAVVMHGKRAAENRYTFEAADDLLDQTPVRVMRAFADAVERRLSIGDIDYEINAAMKNAEHRVVTVLGEFHFENGGAQPFVCMISEA